MTGFRRISIALTALALVTGGVFLGGALDRGSAPSRPESRDARNSRAVTTVDSSSLPADRSSTATSIRRKTTSTSRVLHITEQTSTTRRGKTTTTVARLSDAGAPPVLSPRPTAARSPSTTTEAYPRETPTTLSEKQKFDNSASCRERVRDEYNSRGMGQSGVVVDEQRKQCGYADQDNPSS